MVMKTAKLLEVPELGQNARGEEEKAEKRRAMKREGEGKGERERKRERERGVLQRPPCAYLCTRATWTCVPAPPAAPARAPALESTPKS
jgi:hypothetical protein